MFHTAKHFVDIGYSVIGLADGSKQPRKGFSWKVYQERKPTDSELISMFGALSGRPNIAVVCGAVSGDLFVKDFDDKDDAHAFYQQYRRIWKTIVETRRGLHFWTRRPGARSTLGAHSDGRGEGGYAVAPPSVVNGFNYRFRDGHGLVPPEELPEYPDELIERPVCISKPIARIVDDLRSLERWLMRIESFQGQQGNKGLVRFISRARDAGLAPERCMELLLQWNRSDRVRPPWTLRELWRAVENLYAEQG
jgi:hypothetical protein